MITLASRPAPPAGLPRDLLTVMEVVRRYKTSRQTLHRLCATGRLYYYLAYNGRRRFSKADTDAFFALKAPVAPAAPPQEEAPEPPAAPTPRPYRYPRYEILHAAVLILQAPEGDPVRPPEGLRSVITRLRDAADAWLADSSAS